MRDALKDGVRKRKKKARLMGELGERLKEGSKDKVKSEKNTRQYIKTRRRIRERG